MLSHKFAVPHATDSRTRIILYRVTKKNSLLDRIDVREPCTESWEEMTGNNQVRLCSHCARDVHDLSNMTRVRAEKLVRESNGRLCIRYMKDPKGNVITAPSTFTQIKRQATVAAGVLAATLSLSTLAHSQGSIKHPIENRGINQKLGSDATLTQAFLSVSGTVVDSAGAVIGGAKVILRTINIYRETASDDTGYFYFGGIEPGTYELEISAPGFKSLIIGDMKLQDGFKFENSLVLEVGEVTTGLLVIEGEPLVTEPLEIGDRIETQKLLDRPEENLFPSVLRPVASKKDKRAKQKNRKRDIKLPR